MKKTALVTINLLIAYCGFAQTMTIHYKNGQNVKFNMESIDFIDFQEKSDGGITVTDGEVVDLGLSVLWASFNVGATSCEQFGDKFAWGETETKSSYTLQNYIWYVPGTLSCTYLGDDISGTDFDVAHVKWGGNWRMPTASELWELQKNCSWTWTNVNSVNGFKVIGPNGNSIFIPVNSLANLWSSTLKIDQGAFVNAYELSLDPSFTKNRAKSYTSRYYGLYIRPVMSK